MFLYWSYLILRDKKAAIIASLSWRNLSTRTMILITLGLINCQSSCILFLFSSFYSESVAACHASSFTKWSKVCGHSNRWNSKSLRGCQAEFSASRAMLKQSQVPWICKCKWMDDFVKCSHIKSYTDLNLTSETESQTEERRVSKRKTGINW